MRYLLCLFLVFLVSCKTSSLSTLPENPEVDDINTAIDLEGAENIPDLNEELGDIGNAPAAGCELWQSESPAPNLTFDEVFYNTPEPEVPLLLQRDEKFAPDLPIARTGGCVPFNPTHYNQWNSGVEIAARIKAISDPQKKMVQFLKEFTPLAVYIQSKTNYPASALLAQWSDEADKGTSKQVRVNNNIAGHSCFKYSKGYKYPEGSKVLPSYIPQRFDIHCTYPRPPKEGGYYITFENLLEATLSQVYNILDNPKTQNNYKKTRATVKEATEKGLRANPYKIIDGLEGYAAFPKSYRDRIKANIKKNKFDVYDNMEVCGDKETDEAPKATIVTEEAPKATAVQEAPLKATAVEEPKASAVEEDVQ
jgi:hypothetical protein